MFNRKEWMKQYRQTHKEQGREQKRRDYYKHREQRLIDSKLYTKEHPEIRQKTLIKYRKRRKEEIALANKKWLLKSKYGLTEEQYETKKKLQGQRCAICNQVKNLCVDHNHKTGRIRGLLCHNCNTALGFLKENTDYLFNAIRYLQIEF